jgi:hypothetical protein
MKRIEELKKGDKVEIIIIGTVIDSSDSHGLCYEVEFPIKDYIEARTFWFDEDEVKLKTS